MCTNRNLIFQFSFIGYEKVKAQFIRLNMIYLVLIKEKFVFHRFESNQNRVADICKHRIDTISYRDETWDLNPPTL